MRARVYVDEFNLYYRALRRTPYRWLAFYALATSLLESTDTIEGICYFTARVSPRAGDEDAPRRQQAYLGALSTLPRLSIHYGRFLPKTKWRPIAHPNWDPHVPIQVHDTEEKGSDVNLASHLINDAHFDRYDVALVMSQDSDLREAMRMVKNEIGKIVGLAWLDGREPSRRMRDAVSFVRHVTPSRLSSAQLPAKILGRNGHHIEKPEGW